MSSEPSTYLIHIPAADNMPLWASTRASHIAHLKPYIDDGTILFGGPTLAEHPDNPANMKVTGALLLFKAGSGEEVREIVRANPMSEVGVWDAEGASVMEYRCEVRRPAVKT